MAEGKWISDLRATTPLDDAARRVLTVRLQVVGDYLPKALRQADQDVEHVHQLRVATRRAAAALRIFADCLPDKVCKTARRRLRQVRRAAGEARDWDVFLLGLDGWGGKPTRTWRAGLDFLIGYGVAQRVSAQEHLVEVGEDFPFFFDRLLADTLAAVTKPRARGLPADASLLDLARPLLGELLRELHEAASGDLDDYEHLHQVRIIGKRLRYAMEVFADCFAAPFREELYPAVEQMQEILGNANDSHVAAGRLIALREKLRAVRPADWKRYRPGVEGLLKHHEKRLPVEKQRFVEWWQVWQESGTEDALAALLHGATVPDE
jgi:CHAD domain-containing protein